MLSTVQQHHSRYHWIIYQYTMFCSFEHLRKYVTTNSLARHSGESSYSQHRRSCPSEHSSKELSTCSSTHSCVSCTAKQAAHTESAWHAAVSSGQLPVLEVAKTLLCIIRVSAAAAAAASPRVCAFTAQPAWRNTKATQLTSTRCMFLLRSSRPGTPTNQYRKRRKPKRGKEINMGVVVAMYIMYNNHRSYEYGFTGAGCVSEM